MNYINQRVQKLSLPILFIVLLGIVFYSVTLRGVPGNPKGSDIKNNLDQNTKPLELSPERGRYILTMSLAENMSLSLTPELADAAYPDTGYSEGKYYILFAPGVSLFALPFYLLGRSLNLAQVATFAVMPFFAIGSMIVLYKLSTNLLKFSNSAGLVSAITFGFASTAWSYATTLYQHHVTTFFILSAFYAVWKYKQNLKSSYLWAVYVWFAYALAILVDYPNAMLMAPVMIYFGLVSLKFKNLKNKFVFNFNPLIIVSSIIFLVITGLHLYSNYVHYGDWKRLSNSIVSVKTLQDKKVLSKAKIKSQEEFKKIESEKTAASFFRETNLPRGLSILLAGPDKGIFLFSPIFILAILGIWKALKKVTLEIGILLSLIIVNFLLYASFGDPWGGWAFGPRYLILSMSLFALFIPFWMDNKKYSVLKKTIYMILFSISSAISLVGALTTNAIPPKTEAIPLGTKYNFLRNFDFLLDNKSSSYVYNTFISNFVSLPTFYAICLGLLLIAACAIIYGVPYKRK